MMENSFYIFGNTLRMKRMNLVILTIFFQHLVIKSAVLFQISFWNLFGCGKN
jgi:hypothetical protein